VTKTDLTVNAVDKRPAISGFEPRSGAAGSTVTIAGTDLAGWAATVRIGGQLVLNRTPVSTTNFVEATVPALPPAVYEIEVDVSGLATFTGPFEVTP
jgi:hypothetical protein